MMFLEPDFGAPRYCFQLPDAVVGPSGMTVAQLVALLDFGLNVSGVSGSIVTIGGQDHPRVQYPPSKPPRKPPPTCEFIGPGRLAAYPCTIPAHETRCFTLGQPEGCPQPPPPAPSPRPKVPQPPAPQPTCRFISPGRLAAYPCKIPTPETYCFEQGLPEGCHEPAPAPQPPTHYGGPPSPEPTWKQYEDRIRTDWYSLVHDLAIAEQIAFCIVEVLDVPAAIECLAAVIAHQALEHATKQIIIRLQNTLQALNQLTIQVRNIVWPWTKGFVTSWLETHGVQPKPPVDPPMPSNLPVHLLMNRVCESCRDDDTVDGAYEEEIY